MTLKFTLPLLFMIFVVLGWLGGSWYERRQNAAGEDVGVESLAASLNLPELAANAPHALTDEELEAGYREGVAVYRSEGPDGAMPYFERKFSETGALEYLYGIAWCENIGGNMERARDLGRYILSHKPKPLLQARCYYMLGYQFVGLNQPDEAVDHFQKAAGLYRSLEAPTNLFNTHLGLAHAFILKADYNAAQSELNQAYLLHESLTDNRLGYFFHLKTRIAFGQGNFRAGVSFAERELQEFQKTDNPHNTAMAMGDLGFFHGLTGAINDCEAVTQKARALLAEADAPNQLIQLEINDLMVARCRNRPSEPIEAVIEEILKTHPELHYKKPLFDYVRERECFN